jgi:hypothetical protein
MCAYPLGGSHPTYSRMNAYCLLDIIAHERPDPEEVHPELNSVFFTRASRGVQSDQALKWQKMRHIRLARRHDAPICTPVLVYLHCFMNILFFFFQRSFSFNMFSVYGHHHGPIIPSPGFTAMPGACWLPSHPDLPSQAAVPLPTPPPPVPVPFPSSAHHPSVTVLQPYLAYCKYSNFPFTVGSRKISRGPKIPYLHTKYRY